MKSVSGIVKFDSVRLLMTVCPLGGAISNMYAMLLARFKMFPEVKEKGMSSVPRLAAFTSEHVGVSLYTNVTDIISKCKKKNLLMLATLRDTR